MTSLAGFAPHYIVGETFGSKAGIRVPKEKTFLRREHPRSIYCPNTFSFFSTENLSNFRSFDSGATEVATKLQLGGFI